MVQPAHMLSSSACTCAVGEGLGRYSYVPIPQQLARRPTALHGRRGGGHTSSKFIAVWILNVLADTTHRMEKQKQCGQNSGLRSFKKSANTHPQTRVHHLFHDKTTCNLTGSPKGLVHNLLMQFFTLGSSKIEVFKTIFFNTLIT